MPIYFEGLNKSELRKEIQRLLLTKSMDEEFESTLISNLIASKHYFCFPHGLRPTRFKKTRRNGGGYLFMGYFPEHGWHPVSWDKSITQRHDLKLVKDALRLAVDPEILEYKSRHPVCEHCHLRPSQECHHASPTFEELFQSAICDMTDDEWVQIWRAFEWWNKEPFQIPQSAPLLRRFVEAHRRASLQALCQQCHLTVHANTP